MEPAPIECDSFFLEDALIVAQSFNLCAVRLDGTRVFEWNRRPDDCLPLFALLHRTRLEIFAIESTVEVSSRFG